MDIVSKWLSEANIQNALPELGRRRQVFDFLREKIRYDAVLMNSIANKRAVRNPVTEFDSVFVNLKGICSSISQVYHVMLSAAGISSRCLCCIDNSQPHELVYFYTTRTFDDPTSAIIYRKQQPYFNYSVKTANTYGQGNEAVLGGARWIPLPHEWIEYVTNNSSFSPEIGRHIYYAQQHTN